MRARVLIAIGLVLVASAAAGARAHAVEQGPDASPVVAYVTETASSPAAVWVTRADGTERRRLGPGSQPLIAPHGEQVVASLSGAGAAESGPAVAVYSTNGQAPLTFFSLAKASAAPLAWSRDTRYVAVALYSTAVRRAAARSGLAILDLASRKAKMIARGQIYGASFAPHGSDTVVYGRAASQSPAAPVNLYESRPDGSARRALTRDGRSLNPVWGRRWIAYDRERLRANEAPQYQIWLRSPARSRARRLTHVPAGPLVSGLVPLGFGQHCLLAEFEGQDTSEAWTVALPGGRAHKVTVRGRAVQGAGISADGSTLLVEEGALGEPPSAARVSTVAAAGGSRTVVVAHGGQASWTGGS